ncbi:Fungal-trans domain-containing protein [Mycena indigotica]|uniref:Fungal-trans domain-containing protein n=1 Tax=Mycena indigotica TaxID=2126181 RepID=A0A8H6TE11_9AGAR|nr:Fungal-trans domain-containing protein [Mycena indigotica]KAF7315953.1 Fungal-trans domain-containing protein [Mycena indigotica]
MALCKEAKLVCDAGRSILPGLSLVVALKWDIISHRKRKMRCDGAKPACQQCARAKKGEACEYDDGKGKTRTQILRETIVRLEQRVRELEDPDYVSPAVTLFDPHTFDPQALRSLSESPPSSSYDSADASFSAGHSPFPSDSAHSPEGSWSQAVSASPPLFGADMFFQEPQSQINPPLDLALMLLEIFTPHRHQCGLQVHMGQLKDSLNRSLAEQRHPVLMNAIYLWACFISRPGPLSQHEDHYLSMALDALQEALRDGDKTLDIVQAECLLSTYFLSNGRVLEGSYHASAAAALAVQCGLQEQLQEERSVGGWLSDNDDMKPLKMDLRRGERVLAFWQVYNLDRCWSVVLRKSTIIPDGPQAWNAIHAPWPLDMTDYQTGALVSGANFQTIKSFVEGDVASNGYSNQAMRAKASALFERASSLSISWDSRIKPSDPLRQEIHSLELTIGAFLSTLPPLHTLDTVGPEDKPVLITAHTLVHTALIHLYQRFVPDDRVSYDKCARAARACGTIITHINDADFAFLDPILAPCWTAVAEALLRELATINSAWPMNGADADVRNELGTVMYALTSLASKLPIASISVAKLQKRLAEL